MPHCLLARYGCLFLLIASTPIFSQSIARVSQSSAKIQGNNHSLSPAISADGRYVAFISQANNLTSNPPSDRYGIYVHDRTTGSTEKIRLTDGARELSVGWPSLNADGRYLAFSTAIGSCGTKLFGAWVVDRLTNAYEIVSVSTDGIPGNAGSSETVISADGRFVAFESYASNLDPRDHNERRDVFLHDRLTRQTERVSGAPDGSDGDGLTGPPSLSADGRYVAFQSSSSNLVAGDRNGKCDIFVYDRLTRRTERVSVSSDGSEADDTSYDPGLSGDGQSVIFASHARNLYSGDTNWAPDIFIHDRTSHVTRRVNPDVRNSSGYGGYIEGLVVSGDGKWAAFNQLGTALTPEARGVFLATYILDTVSSRIVYAGPAIETTPNLYFWSSEPAISQDGAIVAFQSLSSRLVTGDTNGVYDIFARSFSAPHQQEIKKEIKRPAITAMINSMLTDVKICTLIPQRMRLSLTTLLLNAANAFERNQSGVALANLRAFVSQVLGIHNSVFLSAKGRSWCQTASNIVNRVITGK